MPAKKYLTVFVLLSLFIATLFARPLFSIDCNPDTSVSGLNENDLKALVDLCSKKVGDLRNQANTLSSQIQYMDTQIYLTGLQIRDTEQKIISTQKEIETLGTRIEGLDSSLNYLSKLLINKIVEGYKQRSVSLFTILLDSISADDLINRIKYLKTARQKNQNLLIQVQETKTNFEEQKTLREEKKVELDQLTQTLNNQQLALNTQKGQKQKLLADTRNDEDTYQRLLSRAQAQLRSFKSFVQSSGADFVIGANAFGNGSDGAYYSQRDERWANHTIGVSSENILSVGCLVTSVSMVAKRYGQNVTPADIASDNDRFYASTAWMSLPWKSVAGRSYNGGVDVNQELQNGNYVIAGVGNCANGGSHFVVLTKKDGDDYIMHDPIYGPDIKFSSHYSNICSAATFK